MRLLKAQMAAGGMNVTWLFQKRGCAAGRCTNKTEVVTWQVSEASEQLKERERLIKAEKKYETKRNVGRWQMAKK